MVELPLLDVHLFPSLCLAFIKPHLSSLKQCAKFLSYEPGTAFPRILHMRQAKTQISLYISIVWSASLFRALCSEPRM